MERLLRIKSEVKDVDFKSGFNPTSAQDWCELVKDIIAIANSGGGFILIGVNDNGESTELDISPILEVDQSHFSNKIRKYTGVNFADVQVTSIVRENTEIAVLQVPRASSPILFIQPGTYPIEDNRQKTAFSAGTLYVRHGAKSEPANTEDLRQIIQEKIDETRSDFLKQVRRVVTAPVGSQVTVAPPSDVVQSTSPSAQPIKITDDPSAPEYRIVDPNDTHKLRLKDLIEKVNVSAPSRKITNFDLLSVRRVYEIESKREFYYKPMSGSPQYSEGYLKWLEDQQSKDTKFFDKARYQYAVRKEDT